MALSTVCHIATQIRIGGMVFCDKEQRGIRRGYLPPPCEVEFTKDTTYEDVLAHGRKTFFSELPEEQAVYYLVDSSGDTLPNFNPGMTFRQYFWASGNTPSKTWIYTLQRCSGELHKTTMYHIAS